jgi:hypothetical protein
MEILHNFYPGLVTKLQLLVNVNLLFNSGIDFTLFVRPPGVMMIMDIAESILHQ